MDDRGRAREIDRVLASIYPGATALHFSSPFELLVAAILAAQCTDERVNGLTPQLFERYPGAPAFARAPIEELEEAVKSTGFFRQKARALKACSQGLLDRYGGEVPRTVDELTILPGVGRKTANLVLGNSMGVPGVFVDTHVKRVSCRLGLTRNTDPDKIETDVSRLIEPERQVKFSNRLTHLGRQVCVARKPKCSICPVKPLCPRAGVKECA